MYSLMRKMEILRNKLKIWCLDKRLFWGVNWRKVFNELHLQGTQVRSISQGNALVQRHQVLLSEASMALHYWQQRIKDRHLQLGDIPSKFLFNRLRQKKQKNYVFLLSDSTGVWVEDPNEISLMIQAYFMDIYRVADEAPLSNSQQGSEIDLVLRELNLPQFQYLSGCRRGPSFYSQALLTPISSDEIRSAMFEIANDKSPGLDGMPAEFFKLHWELIGPSVTQAIQRFFTSGFLWKEWNKTLLVLIPKSLPPEEVSQFRPIGLCNVVYKCIAKCMVHRMKHLLPRLIADYQNAFVPGRHMDDNILISHELTHIINKQRSGLRYLAALKLDMNKAYDRVSWLFLLKCLQAYGFPVAWIRLIEQCISTVSYRVLINGSATPLFKPTCGLRQGDPLSPYLFLFCMDILSRMTSLATDIGQFRGIKIGQQEPTISHLFFADDALFFFRASEDACQALNSMITRFCSVSG